MINNKYYILLKSWILKNNGGVCSTIAGNGLINWIYDILTCMINITVLLINKIWEEKVERLNWLSKLVKEDGCYCAGCLSYREIGLNAEKGWSWSVTVRHNTVCFLNMMDPSRDSNWNTKGRGYSGFWTIKALDGSHIDVKVKTHSFVYWDATASHSLPLLRSMQRLYHFWSDWVMLRPSHLIFFAVCHLFPLLKHQIIVYLLLFLRGLGRFNFLLLSIACLFYPIGDANSINSAFMP